MSSICRWLKRVVVSNCNWCGVGVCEDCIRNAIGKKYCLECSKKLKPLKSSGLSRIQKIPVEEILKEF